MARSKKAQSKHDAEVRRIAMEYKNKHYEVKADVGGFPRPDTIGGFRPDVVATKDGERKIIEVETTDSVNSSRDKKQQQAFSDAAKKSKNTIFKRKVIK